MATEIGRLVEQRARESSSTPAFIEARTGTLLTWGALARTVAACQEEVSRGHLAAGSAVALSAERPLGFIGAYLGLLAAQMVVLPVDPTRPAMVEEFGPCAVATVPPEGPGMLVVGHEAGHGAGGPVEWAEPATVMLRTSGSTGRPKGVPLPERLLLHGARCVAGHHELKPGERMYSPLPLFHINAQVVGVLACLVSGATLVVDARFHRSGFWDVLERCGVTVLNAVPAILAILAQDAPPSPALARRIRFARSASAPLPLATLRRFEDHCRIGVLETYGMTEAAGQICANPLRAPDRRPGSVGQPVGFELRIVDDGGCPLGASEPGAVQIRGPGVAGCYVIPGATGEPPRCLKAVDASGWLTTGDAGYQDPDGFVTLMGRQDGVINRGGEKVYPREVEEVLRRHAGVGDAAVVGEPDPVLGERLVAFIVPSGAACANLVEELAVLCRRELGRPRQPARIEVIAALPSTGNGKVRRDRLREMAAPAALAPGPGRAGEPDRRACEPESTGSGP